MDSEKLTETYIRLKGRLKGMASSILRNEEDADDALQEAFCKIWSKKEDVVSATSEGLAVMAVKRVCLSYLRKRSYHTSVEPCSCGAHEEHPSATVCDEDEVRDLTQRLMSVLSPRQRKVFGMVSEGVDYDIIALRLGMSEDSVRQTVCRTRKILRDEYRKYI